MNLIKLCTDGKNENMLYFILEMGGGGGGGKVLPVWLQSWTELIASTSKPKTCENNKAVNVTYVYLHEMRTDRQRAETWSIGNNSK